MSRSATSAQTPSRAEHGPRGRLIFAFTWPIILLSFLLVPSLTPTGARAAESPPFYWEFINVEIDVQENGDMLVTETQKYVFTGPYSNERYRYIRKSWFGVRLPHIDSVQVLEKGKPLLATTGVKVLDRKKLVWIRWRHQLVPPESHTFVLKYRVQGALHFSPDADMVYWEAISGDRTAPIQSAKVTVRLPSLLAGQIRDFKAEGWSRWTLITDMDAEKVDAQTVEFVPHGPLAPGRSLTVKVSFPHGILAVPVPVGQQPKSQTMSEKTAHVLILVLLIGVVLAVFVVYRRKQKCPRCFTAAFSKTGLTEETAAPTAATSGSGRVYQYKEKYKCSSCGFQEWKHESVTIKAHAGLEAPPDFSRFPVTVRRWLGKGESIEIHRDLVRVTGLFGEHKWEEPVSAFKGVLRRTGREAHYGGPYGGKHWETVYWVDLVHPDSGKTLRLYRADTDEGIRTVWGDAARALDLPALEETTDGIVTHAPEDLDKSIPELAAEGKVLPPVNGGAPPPRGITRERVHGEVHLTIRAVKLGKEALSFAIFLGFAPLFFYIASYIFGHEEFREWIPSALPYVLGAIILILGGSTFADMIVSRRIVIAAGEVRYFRKSPFGTFGLKAIPLNELKSVRRISTVGGSGLSIMGFPVSLGHGDKLVMESDTATISVGRLDEHQLRWLEQFILAASIDAPRP